MIIAKCRDFSKAVIVLGGAGFSIFPQAVLRFLKADPRFYLAKGLEEWLDSTIRTYMAERPFCTM